MIPTTVAYQADQSPVADRTWEGAVRWLREQPAQRALVEACYYDDPIGQAADRYAASSEWHAIRALLSDRLPGRVLDVGAGRGISSYAFATVGCAVTALEPDPSPLVGTGAIAELVRTTGCSIATVEEFGERLPFDDESFDVVYGRAVMHHAADLRRFCAEAARVLRRGGAFLGTREHVISSPQDLEHFLKAHPLHSLYGGENAFELPEYLSALEEAGLRVEACLGPFDSPINWFPMTECEVAKTVAAATFGPRLGRVAARLLPEGLIRGRWAAKASAECRIPGRLYSFLAVKA